jgi:hypothetical protein
MLLVVPLVAITGFPQWIPHFSALAFDDDDDDDLPWPCLPRFMALKEYNRLQIRKTPSVCVKIYHDLKKTNE